MVHRMPSQWPLRSARLGWLALASAPLFPLFLLPEGHTLRAELCLSELYCAGVRPEARQLHFIQVSQYQSLIAVSCSSGCQEFARR